MVRISPLIVLLAAIAFAHEIPRDVTVNLRIEVQANRLAISARVPLKAMRDVEFPELPGGYLNIPKLEPQLSSIATTWISNAILLREGSRDLPRPKVLATRLAIESDRSFDAWQGAPTGELGSVVWNQLWLDVLMDVPIQSATSSFSIRPGMEKLGIQVLTILRFNDRLYELHGDPGWIDLDPTWWGATRRFATLGFHHILDGMDHLLFLLCLVIPIRSLWKLVGVVSAFTVGHSVTLIGAALGFAPEALWFPALVEVVIAASILWMAIENITEMGTRWLLVGAFGLIHGFGFSFALRESLQFAGGHLLSSLVAFNLGVELGQLLVVGCLWGILRFITLERIWIIVISTLVAHTAWHWMWDRWEILRKYFPS
jgi:hypothetical protein